MCAATSPLPKPPSPRDELRQRTHQVAELNRGLEARVAEQVEELGRVRRLRRFLAPQLAELIVSQGDEKILESALFVVGCAFRNISDRRRLLCRPC